MDSLKPNVLLQFNENQLNDVRENYGYNVNRLVQDIDIFEDWIAKQNHFRVRKFDREYLERYLIYNKGSIERAKKHFDNLCTYRNLMPEFLQNFDTKTQFDAVRKCCKTAVLPKPTSDNYRISVMTIHAYDENFDIAKFYKYVIGMVEYTLCHDYCNGWEIIFDSREMPYLMMTKLNPIVISKALSLIVDTMGQRLKALHFLSGSKFFDAIVNLFKQAMSQKLANRVNVHSSIEFLQEVIGKNTLPIEYGGNGKSMQEYDDDIFRVLSSPDHVARMKFLESATTDESCRLTSKVNDPHGAIPGSFKSITID